MATEQEILTALSDSQATVAAISSALAEATNELTGLPATIAALNATVADLNAQLAAQQPGVIPQSVTDAVTALNASLPAVQTAAANLANIVPNPVA